MCCTLYVHCLECTLSYLCRCSSTLAPTSRGSKPKILLILSPTIIIINIQPPSNVSCPAGYVMSQVLINVKFRIIHKGETLTSSDLPIREWCGWFKTISFKPVSNQRWMKIVSSLKLLAYWCCRDNQEKFENVTLLKKPFL